MKLNSRHASAPRLTPASLIKAIVGLGLLWLLAPGITEGLAGEAPDNRVAIAPLAPVKRDIEWRPVADSHGYLLQLRDQNTRLIIERRLDVSRTTVELQPGRYTLRVASLNKFGKPASWTAWANLNLRRPAPPDATADQPPAASPQVSELAAQMPKNESHSADSQGFQWRILIPGLSQYQRGQTWRGLAWMAGFAGLGAAGYGFWQTGNNLALSADAATPLLVLAPLTGQTAASFVLLQDRAAARSAYDAAQADQRAIGIIAGVLYLLQIADALWLAPRIPEARDPRESGLTALRAGDLRLAAEFRAPVREYGPATEGLDANSTIPNQGIHLKFTTRF
ncbi:MAG: hypothetical protein RIF32_05835 [Leptospirales bacterium]